MVCALRNPSTIIFSRFCPFPNVVGGGDAWLVVIQRPDTAGLLPGFLSVRRDFRPGLSSASRESGVTNLPESSGRRGMVPEIYPGQMQPGHYCTSFITMNCCTNGVLVTRSPRLGSGFDISLPPCPELLIGMISPIPASLSSVR